MWNVCLVQVVNVNHRQTEAPLGHGTYNTYDKLWSGSQGIKEKHSRDVCAKRLLTCYS